MFSIRFHVHAVEFYVNGKTGHRVNVSIQNTEKVVNGRAIVMCKFFLVRNTSAINFSKKRRKSRRKELTRL